MTKNTSIALSDHFAEFLNEQVASGRYGSASEVVRAGLRLLEEREAALADLRAEIAKGEASGVAEGFDVDDWFEGLQPTNRAYHATDPEKNPDENRDIYAQIIHNATAVITSTPFLYNFYKAKRDNVYMVRNGIDIDRWKRRENRKGVINLGRLIRKAYYNKYDDNN